MKKTFFAALFSLLPCLAFAAGSMPVIPGPGVKGYGDSFASLWSEDWVGTDPNWTISIGSPDTNYTSTIAGQTENLYISARTAAADQELYRDFTVTTSGSIANARFKIKCSDIPTSTGARALSRFATSTTARGAFYINYSSGVKLSVTASGGSSVVTSSTIVSGETYWVHTRFQKGTGSNAKASISFGTTWPVPTSTDNAYAESLNGTGTVDINRLYIGGDDYSSSTSSYNCEIGKVEYWESTTW